MEDPNRFNVIDTDGRGLCPVCGFDGTFRGDSYDERGGVIGSGICFCCLWEPGFDDSAAASGATEPTMLESVVRYRRDWLASGAEWCGKPELKPQGWGANAQLTHLTDVAPFLA